MGYPALCLGVPGTKKKKKAKKKHVEIFYLRIVNKLIDISGPEYFYEKKKFIDGDRSQTDHVSSTRLHHWTKAAPTIHLRQEVASNIRDVTIQFANSSQHCTEVSVTNTATF